MKTLALLTGRSSRPDLLAAITKAASQNKMRVATLARTDADISLTTALWNLLTAADFVVADVSDLTSDTLYEIGLAHGIGKPVLLVTATRSKSLPTALGGQECITFELNPDGLRNLSFRISQILQQALHGETESRRLRGPSFARDLPTRRTQKSIGDLKKILALTGHERAKALETWFADLCRRVSGWDVIGEAGRGRDQGYDLVIWNHSDDPELSTLGNPIPVEIKATDTLRTDSLLAACTRAQKQRLQSLVFVTTARSTTAAMTIVRDLYHNNGFIVVFLDRQSLLRIKSAPDVIRVVRRALRHVADGGWQ